jgi:ABC-2 type transport system ATP-binding protein
MVDENGGGEPVVLAEGLRKRFGDVTALDGFDLRVAAGTVCGLLGPNGAGKTTAVRILTTLLRAGGGRARVAGFDVAAEPAQVRRQVGVVGQSAAVDEVLTGRQNLVLFGRLSHLTVPAARRRAAALLERFGLAGAADRPVAGWSGGMRRRLDLAAGLVLDPPVLVLDEPTTGLDPRGRDEVWRSVRALVADGTTVLLTTQYLEEADQLADRVAVVDAGRVVAEGPPAALKARLGGDRIDVVVPDAADLGRVAALVARATGAGDAVRVEEPERRVGAPAAAGTAALTAVVGALAEAGIAPDDVALRRPTLDEVFLHLTGGRA